MRWFVAVSAVLLALFTAGCGLIGGSSHAMQKGDCLKKDGEDSFATVSCSSADAGFVVLDKVGSGGTENGCVNVAGTEYVQYESGGGSVCVGVKGADTAHAVNAAQKGNCLTDTGGKDVRKVECGDPTAVYRVLDRVATTGFMPEADCKKVAGTQTTYSYILKSKKGVNSLGTGVVFCLIAKDSDPARTIDNAKVGDCLKPSGADDVQLTPCSSPDARYKILSSELDKSLCDKVSGSNATYTYQTPGEIWPKVYCLGTVH